jgi:hypothetical protein
VKIRARKAKLQFWAWRTSIMPEGLGPQEAMEEYESLSEPDRMDRRWKMKRPRHPQQWWSSLSVHRTRDRERFTSELRSPPFNTLDEWKDDYNRRGIKEDTNYPTLTNEEIDEIIDSHIARLKRTRPEWLRPRTRAELGEEG